MKGGWTADWGLWGPQYLALVGRASAPYDCFVYGAQADAVGRALWGAGRSEFGPSYGRAWVAGGQVAGVLACLPGAQLAGCRLQAALILKKTGLLPAATARRARLAGAALLRPEGGDYYLSRLAVAPSWRRRGLGRLLLQACEAAGRQQACSRVVLEAGEGAGGFYRCCGYAPIGRGRAFDAEDGKGLDYVHWAKELN